MANRGRPISDTKADLVSIVRGIVWLGAAAYGGLVLFTFVQAIRGQAFLPMLGP